MKVEIRLSVAILLVILAYGCRKEAGGGKEESGQRTVAVDEPSKITEVTAETLHAKDFNHEIVSNGKAAGHDHADLYFPQQEGIITGVFVKNGSFVRRGARIAALDTFRLEERLNQAETALAKAELDLKDAIIGQGYDPDEPEKIPQEVMRLARLRSGHIEAESAVKSARRDLDQAVVKAPFDGVIANLNGKPFNRPDGSKPLCSIIGNGMDVDFKVLESELPLIKTGDRVEVAPFSHSSGYVGSITQINPAVDDNGMVAVTASVDGGNGLFDGMNVRVSIKKCLGSCIVVPKTAVVLRGGRQVVFTLNEKGDKAMWNYVKTGLENMDEYTITEGLNDGMKVIVGGNMNLAHESPVKLLNK